MKIALHPLLVCALMLHGFSAHAQFVLNGDFENTTGGICQYNISNAAYTSMMPDSWGFGQKNELDIQKSTCSFALAPSNNWFVSLSSYRNSSDALSLKLSSRLIPGNTYFVSYFLNTSDLFDNQIVPLQVGLSTDSLSFGTLLHSAIPVLGTWTLKSFSFVAPVNGLYLTLSNDTSTLKKAWNFVDNVQLLNTTEISESSTSLPFSVFPNPSAGRITISSSLLLERIEVCDFSGTTVQEIMPGTSTTSLIGISDSGLYFIKATVSGNTYCTKVLIAP